MALTIQPTNKLQKSHTPQVSMAVIFNPLISSLSIQTHLRETWIHDIKQMRVEPLKMELRGQCPICFFTLVTSPTRGSTQPGVEGSQTQHTFFNSSHDSDSKESACNAGDLGSIPESRRSPGEGNSFLENSMDREAWWATVHGVAKSQIRPSD